MAYSHLPKRTRRPVTSYTAAHDLVRATKGSPSAHTCITCGGIAQEWALLPFYPGICRMTYGPHAGKAFNPNPSAYVSMCRSHHRRLDYAVRITLKAPLAEGQVAA
jgi:hypothetical protein